MLSLAITPLRRATKWNQLIALRRPLGLSGFTSPASTSLCTWVWTDPSICKARSKSFSSPLSANRIARHSAHGTLAITSTDSMVRRLGAKRWKQLHRLAYVAVAAGALHYYLLVKAEFGNRSRPRGSSWD